MKSLYGKQICNEIRILIEKCQTYFLFKIDVIDFLSFRSDHFEHIFSTCVCYVLILR